MDDIKRFLALRKKLFGMIDDYFKGDGHCKSYEGDIEVCADYGTYFDDPGAVRSEPVGYVINVHVYVVGPGRHYSFDGKTLGEALDKFSDALVEWELGNGPGFEEVRA